MKRALVTGGSSPIGQAICEDLATQGMHVVVHSNRNLTTAQNCVNRIQAAGGSAEALALDILNPDSAEILSSLTKKAPIQVLVHCIGGQIDKPFAAMDIKPLTMPR